MTSQHLNQETRRAVDVLRDRLEKFPTMFTADDRLAYIELLKQYAIESEAEAIRLCLRVADGLIEQEKVRKDLTGAVLFQISDAVWDQEQEAKEEIQLRQDITEQRHQRELCARWAE